MPWRRRRVRDSRRFWESGSCFTLVWDGLSGVGADGTLGEEKRVRMTAKSAG